MSLYNAPRSTVQEAGKEIQDGRQNQNQDREGSELQPREKQWAVSPARWRYGACRHWQVQEGRFGGGDNCKAGVEGGAVWGANSRSMVSEPRPRHATSLAPRLLLK